MLLYSEAMAPKCSPSAGHHSIASASSGGKHPPGLAANSSHIISDGAHLTDEIALTLVECREILEEATAKEEQAQTQEQINVLKAMITDMDQKPKKPRIREMAKLLNVPQKQEGNSLKIDDLYRAVQKSFLKNVAAIKKDRECHRGQSEQRAEQLMADVRAFGRWPLQHAKSEDPERERERLLAQRVAKMRAAACLPPAAVEELKALASQHRGAQRTTDPYFCSIAEQVAAGAPACMMYEWMVLMQRLDFMSSSPIPKDILVEFAKPKPSPPHRKATSWWARSGIVEHPKIPVWCPQGGKQGSISKELMHYNLTYVLLEDAKMFLAAVAEYKRVVHEEDFEKGAENAARELLPKGYFWDGWDKLYEQYTQAVSSSGDQHPVAETETSSASSQCSLTSEEQEKECILAKLIRERWDDLHPETRSELNELKDLKEPAIHYWWCQYTESLQDQTSPETYLRACIDTDPEFQTLERRINLLACRQLRAVLQEEQYVPVTSTLRTSYEASYIKTALQEENDHPSERALLTILSCLARMDEKEKPTWWTPGEEKRHDMLPLSQLHYDLTQQLFLDARNYFFDWVERSRAGYPDWETIATQLASKSDRQNASSDDHILLHTQTPMDH